MDGQLFAYDGQSGQWTYTIFPVKALDGGFCASADISFRGQHRCKLVVSLPQATDAVGIEALTRKCINWIDEAERGSDAWCVQGQEEAI